MLTRTHVHNTQNSKERSPLLAAAEQKHKTKHQKTPKNAKKQATHTRKNKRPEHINQRTEKRYETTPLEEGERVLLLLALGPCSKDPSIHKCLPGRLLVLHVGRQSPTIKRCGQQQNSNSSSGSNINSSGGSSSGSSSSSSSWRPVPRAAIHNGVGKPRTTATSLDPFTTPLYRKNYPIRRQFSSTCHPRRGCSGRGRQKARNYPNKRHLF